MGFAVGIDDLEGDRTDGLDWSGTIHGVDTAHVLRNAEIAHDTTIVADVDVSAGVGKPLILEMIVVGPSHHGPHRIGTSRVCSLVCGGELRKSGIGAIGVLVLFDVLKPLLPGALFPLLAFILVALQRIALLAGVAGLGILAIRAWFEL